MVKASSLQLVKPRANHLLTVRQWIVRRITTAIPPPEGNFLAGLLTGDTGILTPHFRSALRESGTSHLVAVSGANVTMILERVLSVFPLQGSLLVIGGSTCALLFALFTGMSSSVFRGALTVSLSLLARAFTRPPNAITTILLSAYIILLFRPFALVADTGFQLSYAAYASIVFLSTPIIKLFKFLPQKIAGTLTETLAATLGTAPIILWKFGSLSLSGLIANPLILWTIPLLTGFSVVLTLIHHPLISMVSWLAARWGTTVIYFFSKYPLLTVSKTISGPLATVLTVGLLCAGHALSKKISHYEISPHPT
jgi:competence protein ComEC